ncbi:YfbR-like 5'-deoxynucleotidase [Blautia sp.]|uniref:YfbR-like 5'-deoxynucleotidase n=1 Tax=Blautia sp. TaxID=1955243 RepID=UPI0025912725|nr:YfbR-like 5'-deoxynucleotidase [Blautia sp.]
MQSDFLRLLCRAKLIKRWSGTLCLEEDDVARHTYDVAVITYLLCVILNENSDNKIDTNKAVTVAIFHDCTDMILTHIISPVKKCNSRILNAVDELKKEAENQIVNMLSPTMQKEFFTILECEDTLINQVVKIADNIDVYCKSLEEIQRGNIEFLTIYKQSLMKLKVHAEKYSYVGEFIDIFLEPCEENNYKFRYLHEEEEL